MLQNQQMTQLDLKEHSVYEFLVSHIYVAKQNLLSPYISRKNDHKIKNYSAENKVNPRP